MNAACDSLNFDGIVEAYYLPLYRFALRLSRNAPDALDLTHETFRIAQRRQHQLRDAGRVSAWLGMILRRLFLQQRRRDTRFPRVDLDAVAGGLAGLEDEPGAGCDVHWLRAAVGSLRDTLRVPMRMFYFEERSCREIARHLSIPVGTVLSRLARGRRVLRQRLGQSAEPSQAGLARADCVGWGQRSGWRPIPWSEARWELPLGRGRA